MLLLLPLTPTVEPQEMTLRPRTEGQWRHWQVVAIRSCQSWVPKAKSWWNNNQTYQHKIGYKTKSNITWRRPNLTSDLVAAGSSGVQQRRRRRRAAVACGSYHLNFQGARMMRARCGVRLLFLSAEFSFGGMLACGHIISTTLISTELQIIKRWAL